MSLILGILDSGGAAAAASSYESIASATGTGSSPTITFSSIPATYKQLQIRYISKSTNVADAMMAVTMTFNSDTGNNYAYHELRASGSTVIGDGDASQANISIRGSSLREASATNTMGAALIDIHDYSVTTKNKTVRYFAGVDTNGAAPGQRLSLGSGLWMNTAAVNEIKIDSTVANFTTSSVFALYGIKG